MDASLPTLSSFSAHPIVLAEVLLAAGANQGQPMAADVLQSLLSSSGWELVLEQAVSLAWQMLPSSQLMLFYFSKAFTSRAPEGCSKLKFTIQCRWENIYPGKCRKPAWQSSKEASNSGAPACRQLHCLGHGCPTFWLAGPHWVKRNYLGLHVCRSLWK